MNMFSVFKKRTVQDFPGGPVVKTPCFHCRGRRRFDPWSVGGLNSHKPRGTARKKERKKERKRERERQRRKEKKR